MRREQGCPRANNRNPAHQSILFSLLVRTASFFALFSAVMVLTPASALAPTSACFVQNMSAAASRALPPFVVIPDEL
jgi:hypothetical protein